MIWNQYLVPAESPLTVAVTAVSEAPTETEEGEAVATVGELQVIAYVVGSVGVAQNFTETVCVPFRTEPLRTAVSAEPSIEVAALVTKVGGLTLDALKSTQPPTTFVETEEELR